MQKTWLADTTLGTVCVCMEVYYRRMGNADIDNLVENIFLTSAVRGGITACGINVQFI